MASFNKEFNQIVDGGGLRNTKRASDSVNQQNVNDINSFLL